MAKRRTPAQQRATRRMIAANRARARQRRASGNQRRAPSRRRPARRRNPTPAKRRQYSRTATMPTVRRRRRRNPRRLTMANAVNQVFVPSLTGASGAIAMDLLWGFITPRLPATMQQPAVKLAGKALTSVGLAMLLGNVVRQKTALEMGIGAMTVVTYEAAKGLLANVPGLQGLGLYIAQGGGMGYYNPASAAGGDYPANGAMGAYSNPANGRSRLGLYTDPGGSRSASHAPASDSLGHYGSEYAETGGHVY